MATRSLPEKYVSVDVECVATGRRHDERAVALVAVVDQTERVLLRKKVKPKERVMSYLTPVTQLREGDLDEGEELESVLAAVKSVLGPDLVLVGQGIKRDVKWLKLCEGQDYSSTVELGELFKTYNPRFRKYDYYSLSHVVNTLLNRGHVLDEHNLVTDAMASLRLFKKYYNNSALMQEARRKLLQNRPPPSWAKQNNYRWEGVCMAAYTPSKCSCGAPTTASHY